MSEKEKILKGLSDAVVDMDLKQAVEFAQAAVTAGIDALEAIDSGLADGMQRAGELFEKEEYFIPELLICADAMNAGVEVLKPHIRVESQEEKIKIVLGVIEGDTHDIGKNLVKILIEAGGFKVIDLGRDVPIQKFVDTAIEEEADIIAVSTLMTTTMLGMPKIISLLKEKGVRDKFKVIVGGGPISQAFADKIGADGYSPNASDTLRLVKSLSKR